MQGKITEIRPVIREGRLKVIAKILVREWGFKDAYLPDREVSTLLPRCILAGNERHLPRKFLSVIAPIVRRMAVGRDVRIWTYGEEHYFTFLSWKNIRFDVEEGEKDKMPAVLN
jgi:hypothetical protein